MTMRAVKFSELLKRSLRRRCPMCGGGAIFASHFKMNRECSQCHAIFWKDPGEGLGAMYVDYAVATVAFAVLWPILAYGTRMTDGVQMTILASAAVTSVFVCYPWTRSVWTLLVFLSGGMERPTLQAIRGGKKPV